MLLLFLMRNKIFQGRLIGVLDGVGSWRDKGIDAGKFSRSLANE